MQATLRFSLPEDKEEFERHLAGPEALLVIFELASELRRIRKYEEHSAEVFAVVDRIETKLYEESQAAGIDPMGV